MIRTDLTLRSSQCSLHKVEFDRSSLILIWYRFMLVMFSVNFFVYLSIALHSFSSLAISWICTSRSFRLVGLFDAWWSGVDEYCWESCLENGSLFRGFLYFWMKLELVIDCWIKWFQTKWDNQLMAKYTNRIETRVQSLDSRPED